MLEFKSPYKTITHRKFNTWCKYTARLDTYGCGCQHDCSYCYAKSLLNFRGLWSGSNPRVANIEKIGKLVLGVGQGSVLKLGGMTDCFQPIELKVGVTYETIKLLNKYKIHYLIVTKSDIVAHDKYLDLYDKNLAHFQITITSTANEKAKEYEPGAPVVSKRIKAIEKLYKNGFDVSVRLSPYIDNNVEPKIINRIQCNKILIEFLKVNHFVKKNFKIDYSKYTLKYGGYNNLQLDEKIRLTCKIKNFDQISVGEYVKVHHAYFSNNINYNRYDCCNLTFKKEPAT